MRCQPPCADASGFPAPGLVLSSLDLANVGRLHVFGTEAQAHDAGRNAPQDRKPPQQAQRPGERERAATTEDAAYYAILNQHLGSLGEPGRPFAPPLHLP